MMPRRRGRGTLILTLVAIVVVLLVAGYALYLGNMAGRLPWQEEPTRIPVTPFANLGGDDDETDEDDALEGTPVTAAPRWQISSLAYVDLTPAA
jgi:hypothetical protein